MKIEELESVPKDWKKTALGKIWHPIKGMPKSGRRWAITVNLASMPKSLQDDVLSEDPKRWERCEAWLGQMLPKHRWMGSLEEGDKEHSRHLQLIVVDDTPTQQRYLLEHLGRAHVEPMRSSPMANVAYVSKSKTHLAGPWTNGNWDDVLKERKGKRNDLTDLADRILDLDDDQIDEHTIYDDPDIAATALRFPHVVDRLFTERGYRLQQRRPIRDRTCLWIWGPTSTGKSFDVEWAWSKGYLDPVFKATSIYHPFDGYSREKVLWLEEFRGTLPIERMLMITDPYSHQRADARYADAMLLHEVVIVTTNRAPELVYPDAPELDQQAFLRRWRVFQKSSKDDHPLLALLGVPRSEWPSADQIPDDSETSWLDDLSDDALDLIVSEWEHSHSPEYQPDPSDADVAALEQADAADGTMGDVFDDREIEIIARSAEDRYDEDEDDDF